ncbi:MAG: TIGR03435 family protein [Vicinamibacterales bacterium]
MSVSLLTSLSLAQTQVFDAASVRRNTSGESATNLGFQPDSGRFRASNEPLWRLIAEAYRDSHQLRRFEIVGLTGELDRKRFDVDAVPPRGPHSQDSLRGMLRDLLETRFGLAVHRESRQMPVFHLVRARPDGALGPRLQPSSVDCVSTRSGGPPPPPPPGGPRPCLMIFGGGTLSSDGMTLTNLAEMGLSRALERVVVDRTGLVGGYRWTLEWDPSGQGTGNRVPLTTALEEQLGLKLQPSTGEVSVLVVDRVTEPSDN